MNKPYILSPAGSYDALVSAVNAGADEVYFGLSEFNARQNAENFTPEKLKEAINLCRILGVKTNITVNTLVTDREMTDVLDLVYNGASLGADAFIVQDLGLARKIKEQMPSVCLHASTQCACHNSDGAERLADLGFSRVVLAREMPCEEIRKITALGIETEIFIHGALCVCHSGMCLMSSVIGKRSGNRGLCAQPCRLEYTLEGQKNKGYPLSLKDSCLGTRIEDIVGLGVTSLKIEGRMKSPDYVYNTTKIWREIVDGGKNATKEQIQRLENVFSRGGFTDKYFTGEYLHDNKSMYGIRSDKDKENTRLASKNDVECDKRKRCISLDCILTEGKNAHITAKCGEMVAEYKSDFVCESATGHPLDEETVRESLSKLGTTHFVSENTKVKILGNVFLPKSQLNLLRREATMALEEKLVCPPRVERIMPTSDEAKKCVRERNTEMKLFASCNSLEAATKQKNASYISVPLEEMIELDDLKQEKISAIKGHAVFGVRLPRVIFDSEMAMAEKLLSKAKEKGAVFAEISNIGHIDLCKRKGLSLYASIGMNVFNSSCVKVLRDFGFGMICVSPELNEAQIRDIEGQHGAELCAFVKGRLPLMVLESCIVKACNGCKNQNSEVCSVLTDRIGKKFRVYGEKRLIEDTNYRPCRNIIINSVEADILNSGEKLEKMNVPVGLVYVWE